MKGDPLGTLKKFAKKSLTKSKKPAQKIFGQGRDSNSRPACQTSKAVTSMPSASRSSVTQFIVSASQLIKLMKSVSSLVLKKKKVTTIVCVFLRKAPTEKIEKRVHILHF